MAYDGTYMQFIGGGSSGPRLWTYMTADSQATVATTAYFDSIIDDLQVWDVIIAYVASGGTPAISILAVTSVTTNVAVTDNITQT